MALAGVLRAGVRLPSAPAPFWAALGAKSYAKKSVSKGKGKGISKEDLKGPEVCKDANLLTTHAMGVNFYKQGPEVPLKPDAEYPEWLFQMNLGPPKKLEDLDPETLEYWRALRKENVKRKHRLKKVQPF